LTPKFLKRDNAPNFYRIFGHHMKHGHRLRPADDTLVDEAPGLVAPARGGLWTSKALPLALLVVALVGVLGALAGWRLGWFGEAPRPKEVLRQRLEARPLLPPLTLVPQTPVPEAPEAIQPGAAGATMVIEPPVFSAPPMPVKPVPAMSTSGARFAIEFGPFITAPEAERVERQLNEAGYPTVRFRQQTGAALYAVLIEKIPNARHAQTLVTSLREQGFGGAFVIGEREPLSVQVGLPLPLRGAVRLAERLRASGHAVRIGVQPGEAVTFAIRHGNYATQREAETKGQELMRLGLGNQVVRVK
jgi:SPOR domain